MSNVPMTRPEETLAIHDTRYFHDSSFVALDDGRIMHSAYGVFTYSADGGLSWSEESRRRDRNGDPVGGGGTSLVRLSGKGIGLGVRRLDQDGKVGQEASVIFWRSEDGGETWEPPVEVSSPGVDTHAYQDVLLRTSSGRLIYPVYTAMGKGGTGPNDTELPAVGKLVKGQWVAVGAHDFDPRFTTVYVCYSDDDGRTWERNQDGDLFILLDWNTTFSYINEPSVTEVAPGTLLMMLRTGLGRHFQAWSYDDGATWTRPQPTALASSTTPCQIRTLPNGHLLMVWNQESEAEIKQGYARTRLSAAISRNGGSVWEFFQNVESMHEATRVEPGAIGPTRPAEMHFGPGSPAPERQVEHIRSADMHGRWAYPSAFVLSDRVIIAHTYSLYEEHPTEGRLVLPRKDRGAPNQKQKVLPLSWFYGGKEPADNPYLTPADEPAQP